MRIAWLGPVGDGGGASSLGTLLLKGALAHDIEVDYFTSDDVTVPDALVAHPRFQAVRAPTWWRWNRWYSSRPMTAFLSGTFARTRMHGRLCEMIIDRHRERPYDCIFQFSQSEVFKLGRYLDELPPIVVHPCSHVAGELRWHRRESAYALRSERALMHYAVRLFLRVRLAVQRRQISKPAMIVGPSRRFNDRLIEDYAVPADRFRVLPHPIEMMTEPFNRSSIRPPNAPMKLLFVGRISVRKGFEQIVELSKRLDDLHGQVEMVVIGTRTQWSDYTAHVKDLNPRIARHLGSVPHGDMRAVYDATDVLLVPSLYEPGPLVLGEAMSRGVCAVASDAVGMAEAIDPACCRQFPAGDVDAFERCTRRLLQDLAAGGNRLRSVARAEAERHFSPAWIGQQLSTILHEACGARQIAINARRQGAKLSLTASCAR